MKQRRRAYIVDYRSSTGKFTARIDTVRRGAIVEMGAEITGYYDPRTKRVAMPFGEGNAKMFALREIERALDAAHADEVSEQ